jgi:hypothetical protein
MQSTQKRDSYGFILVPPKFSIVAWRSARTIASSALFPPPDVLARYRGKTPNWKSFDFVIAARDTQEQRRVMSNAFVLLAFMGSSSLAPGFKLQLYDATRKQPLSDRGLNFPNFSGSAARPYFLKDPYPFRENTQLAVRVQNLDVSGANNLIEIVLYGVIDESNPRLVDIYKLSGWR